MRVTESGPGVKTGGIVGWCLAGGHKKKNKVEKTACEQLFAHDLAYGSGAVSPTPPGSDLQINIWLEEDRSDRWAHTGTQWVEQRQAGAGRRWMSWPNRTTLKVSAEDNSFIICSFFYIHPLKWPVYRFPQRLEHFLQDQVPAVNTFNKGHWIYWGMGIINMIYYRAAAMLIRSFIKPYNALINGFFNDFTKHMVSINFSSLL